MEWHPTLSIAVMTENCKLGLGGLSALGSPGNFNSPLTSAGFLQHHPHFSHSQPPHEAGIY